MFRELCATLFLLCNPMLNGFDFNYDMNPRDEFVQGIAECTVKTNTFIPPPERVIIAISVAQAILESDWGRSRFAKEANNFYGIIQTDKTEPHIKSLKNYAVDPEYVDKLLAVTLGLFEKYPHIFKSKEIWEYYKNNRKI
jgi:hypothetical protein